ncbi:DNA polymerase III subunit beta [Bacteriovoracaceae bacterium]|nr:DNA polymerase III subunit beta [Bacteriovoracaceae bacterium]
MQAQVETQVLREAVNKVLSVVDKKNTRPILTYTLVEARDGYLSFSATDLEVSAKLSVPAQINEEGSFCVNAKNLSDILRELPNGSLSLTIDSSENILKINSGKIDFKLLIYKNEDYPQLTFSNVDNQFEISSAEVLEIIQKTSHAISADETRLYLNGIYLQEIDSKLRAVATDGHRLSLIDTEVDNIHNDNLVNGIIIPRKGVNELKKLAETSEAPITLSMDEGFLYAHSGTEYYLSVRLISREYPKYQAVIPAKTTFLMTADKNTLFNAVRRIKIMSHEKSNGIRVNLTAGELTITANHPSLGDAREKISVDYDGKEMEIGFNAKYLIDTLSIVDDGDISFELNNEISPVVVKSSNHPNYLGIIMPLKL